LDSVSDATWDETAVRKVLQIFAYGGQASDAQITTWANMKPADAIKQMLTLDTTNNLLSAPEGAGFSDGTLLGISKQLSTDATLIPDQGFRDSFKDDSFDGPNLSWIYGATLRGLNPFRQKMGFLETNYHMAVNRNNMSHEQIFAYYDRTLASLATASAAGSTTGYEAVITQAAISAAVARQYNHDDARYNNSTGVCDCNQDFAREYHQLFFGILGGADGSPEKQNHETVTIPNTAKALTDMRLHHPGLTPKNDPNAGDGQDVDYGSQFHPTGVLSILNNNNVGTNAQQRFNNQASTEINNAESLDNLPVMFISVLADDGLTDAKKAALRTAWRSMTRKDLLLFLQAYAISTQFHDPKRVKYLNSFDRHLNVANKGSRNNAEQFAEWTEVRRLNDVDQQRAFEPIHAVFGAQTGIETSNSAFLFQETYNGATQDGGRFTSTTRNNNGLTLTRNWGAVIPSTNVKLVAEWLWQRFANDGLKNFGVLERAYMYALLAQGRDLGYVLDPAHANVDHVFTETELTTTYATAIDGLANTTMDLALDPTTTNGQRANRRVGQAIDFILGTPFVLAQEGR
jgi:hypothetical protein